MGDLLVPRFEGGGITGLMYGNVNTSTQGQGFEVNDELDMINKLGVNIQGFSELNKPFEAKKQMVV